MIYSFDLKELCQRNYQLLSPINSLTVLDPNDKIVGRTQKIEPKTDIFDIELDDIKKRFNVKLDQLVTNN